MKDNPMDGMDLSDPALVSVLDELPYWSAPFGIRLLEKIIPRKHMTVLDIGFGTGFPLAEVAMRLGETCTVYGIDPWKEASERTAEKIRLFGIQNIRLINGVAESIPLPSASVDLVISNNGLNNVDDLDKSLAECSRVLKPGGHLVFTMNLDTTMLEFYNVLEQVLSHYDLKDAIASMKRHIREKRRPLGEVKDLLLKNGMQVISIDDDLFSYTFTDGATLFRHFFIRLAFLGAWKDIIPEKWRMSILAEVESKINEISLKQGFFKLSVPFVVVEAVH